MFALCHFKNDTAEFVLFDKTDLREIADHLNIEITKELTFENFDKNYSNQALLYVNDLLLRALNPKARTTTHKLDELKISCWASIKKEYVNVLDKKSKFSFSQRNMIVEYYNLICASK